MAKRRSFTPEYKFQVVLELLSGAKTNAGICREHQLAPTVVSAWREQFLERAPELFATQRSLGAEQERIAELERLVGRLTLEQEVGEEFYRVIGEVSELRPPAAKDSLRPR